MVKKRIWLLCGALMLMLPVPVSAAGVGDVYAALRDIGVPEEYVSQAAGVLARGTSDGAGVYRSDGTYYAYSDMVGYIYANREMILSYCGVLENANAAAETTAVPDGSNPAETTSVQTETALLTTTSKPLTTTTTSFTSTTAVQTSEPLPETTTDTGSDVSVPKNSWLPAAALGCIGAAVAGLIGLMRLIRTQEHG